MQPEELAAQNMYYSAVFIVVAFLAYNAIRTRNVMHVFLAGAFLTKLIVHLIKPLEQEILLRALIDFNDVPLILLFTKYAYHQRQKYPFLIMMLVIMILRVVVGILVISFHFEIPTNRALVGIDLVAYYVYISCGAVMTWLSNGWVVYSAWKVMLKRDDAPPLPSLFKIRNQMIVLGFMPFLLVPVIWFFLPVDGSAYGRGGTWSSAVLVILALAIFFWLFFTRFSRRLKLMKETERRSFQAIASQEGTEIKEWVLNHYGLMAVINYLGEQLSTLISRSSNAAKGLILISIQSHFRDERMYLMKLNQLLDVLASTFKQRLHLLGIGNVDEIVNTLSAKLVDQQSLLTILASS